MLEVDAEGHGAQMENLVAWPQRAIGFFVVVACGCFGDDSTATFIESSDDATERSTFPVVGLRTGTGPQHAVLLVDLGKIVHFTIERERASSSSR